MRVAGTPRARAAPFRANRHLGSGRPALVRVVRPSDTEGIGQPNDDPVSAQESDEEQRRVATHVMAGSVGPRRAGWLFRYEPFARDPRRARRLLLLVAVVEGLGIGFVGWALSSGDDGAILYFLLAVVGLALIAFPVGLAVNVRRARRFRSSQDR